MGRVPRLEDHRGLVIALDQQPDLVVGREVHRAQHPLAPPLGEPGGGRVDQGAGDRGVILGLEEAEHAVVAALKLVPAAIEVGGDPPDHLALALAQEVLGLGVLEERVLGAVQELAALKAQRRHPARFASAQAKRQLYEALEVAAPGDRPYRRR